MGSPARRVKEQISEDDLLSPYLHKRKRFEHEQFEHEQEVRAIIQKPPFHQFLQRGNLTF